ncbi:MAG: ATP-dependent Clp protease proteolytic subunit [Chlamydiae bacterium]|nr:ATP-dependent Clp protease proteolytic subunit [Chlamydiota bacterium]
MTIQNRPSFQAEEEEDPETEPKKKKTGPEEKIDEVLLRARRIFLSDAVDGDSAKDIIRKLWYLELTDPGKPILFVINSPGGAVDSGFAIWDQVKMLSSPVTTLVTGLAASMGSILSLCAAKGRRFATPHSRIMIHQPRVHGVIRGQATDLDIQAKEMIKTHQALVQIYMEATGKDYSTIDKALDRDVWLSPQEALEFGLLDKIVTNYKELA